MSTVPTAMVAAVTAMILGQSWKIVRPVFSGRPPNLRAALQSGGMPSAHTAAAAAMTLVTGLRDGFSSSAFAISFVLTGVVAHDAVKVRGTMNTVIRVLRRVAPEEVLNHGNTLPDTVGHTFPEVIAGFVLALVVAFVCHRFLPG